MPHQTIQDWLQAFGEYIIALLMSWSLCDEKQKHQPLYFYEVVISYEFVQFE